jgi:hypothetical protein
MQFQTQQNEQGEWKATLVDHIGPIGDAVKAPSQGLAIFLLGVIYGRHPERFSRPLEQLINN